MLSRVESNEITTISSTTISLSWKAPETLGPLVDMYHIHYSTQCGGQEISKTISVNNQTLGLELTVLEEAQTYTISLTAENAVGSGKTVTILGKTESTGTLITECGWGQTWH